MQAKLACRGAPHTVQFSALRRVGLTGTPARVSQCQRGAGRIGDLAPLHPRAPETETEFQIRRAYTHYAFTQVTCKEKAHRAAIDQLVRDAAQRGIRELT
jgi:hypothetical protein